MKKLLSVLLCAILVVSAALPCFAEEASSGMTKLDAAPDWLSSATYVPVSSVVDNVYDDEEGYSSSSGLYGSTALWSNTFLPFTINVPSTGSYNFCFKLSGNLGSDGYGVIVKVDGVLVGTTDPSSPSTGFPAQFCLGTMSVTLTKGEHVVEINQATSETTYFHGFYYGYEGAAKPTVTANPPLGSTPALLYEMEAGVMRVSPNMSVNANGVDVPQADLNAYVYGVNSPVDPSASWYGSTAMDAGTNRKVALTIDVPEAGMYAFHFKLGGDANKIGHGLDVITVNGVTTGWSVLFTGEVGAASTECYGPLFFALEEGENTVEVLQTTTASVYYHGFYYYMVPEEEEPEEGGAGEIYVGEAPMLPSTNEVAEGDALGQPNMNVINPVNAPAANIREVAKTAPAAAVTAPAPKQPNVSAKKPAAPGKPGNHASTPARPA